MKRFSSLTRACAVGVAAASLVAFGAAPTIAATAPDFTKAFIGTTDVKPVFAGLPAPEVGPVNVTLLNLTACGQQGQTAAISIQAQDTSSIKKGANPVLSDITQSFYVFDSAQTAKAALTEVQQIAENCRRPYVLGTQAVQGEGPLSIGKVGDASASLGGQYQFTSPPATVQTKSFFIAHGPVVTNVIVTSTKDLTKASVKKWAKAINARLAQAKVA